MLKSAKLKASQSIRLVVTVELLVSILLFKFLEKNINQVHCMAVDHCYSDIGCFPLSDEFYHPRHRPFNVRPWHRKRIKIYFEIYNRQYPEGFVLRPWNKFNLEISKFNPILETKIIIPGWLDNIKRALWVKRMKDSLLWLWKPVNIIVVHWRNFTPYTIATANTRVVGAELANLLRSIEIQFNYDRAYYHLIGHSLGAHIGGYCGDRIAGLGRITALDPARPFFQHMPKSVRLDRGDAKFVDAIHSDFTPENAIFLLMSFGMTVPVGHLDFYPNGPPLLQPGCLRDSILSIRDGIQRGIEHSSLSIAFLESIRYLTACDHQRSHEWFIESIINRQCVFVGVRCNEFDGLINGQCTCDNSKSACAIMGIHADQMFLNDAHEDLWPVKNKKRNKIPLANVNSNGLSQLQMPIISTNNGMELGYQTDEQLRKPTIALREQIYAEMKHHAAALRNPPIPFQTNYVFDDMFSDASIISDSHYNIEDIPDDKALLDYIRSSLNLDVDETIFEPQQQLPRPISPINFMNENEFRQKRVDSSIDPQVDESDRDSIDVELNFGQNYEDLQLDNHVSMVMNEHPKLLSDIDRDIESWYENTSRWYLKTNSRSYYCANQYQLLVYLGPLKTTTGRNNIRANLIISIVGSRGQLTNQRFVPRSKNLDSFTTQPFFILLEGSYSLGSIVSVAIGWEARYDPDPMQATISFQSNLIEEMQSLFPFTYRAKHPWLSETLKYDHTNGFSWSPSKQINNDNNQLLSQVGVNLEKRSLPMRKSSLSSDISQSKSSIKRLNKLDLLQSEQESVKNLKRIHTLSRISLLDNRQMYKRLLDSISNTLNVEDSSYNADVQKVDGQINRELETKMISPSFKENNLNRNSKTTTARSKDHTHYSSNSDSSSIVKKKLRKRTGDNGLTAELHNINIHLDRDLEDSIVINQVLVSPIEAHYGKNTAKVSKTFCPPQQNFRLRRDQTVKLVPSLFEKCNFHKNLHKHQAYKPINQPPIHNAFYDTKVF